jgi:uncharacterized PurR-regulated membrane protein YhhQ (DUF165 family)
MQLIKRELEDYRILLRNVPSLVITLFVVSVIMMNLLANKELLSVKYFALDCGFVLSWISFLCMDMICKRFGPKAAAKVSILALVINLCATLVFKLMSMTPGMWGEYYSTGMTEVNDGLNATFGGSWYVVFGSSVAMLAAAVCNSFINQTVAKRLRTDGYKAFAMRSFISTGIAQFVDNLTFAVLVSYYFFGWTAAQVIVCSLTGAAAELLFEVIFSPVGYRVCRTWEIEGVGSQYLQFAKVARAEAR